MLDEKTDQKMVKNKAQEEKEAVEDYFKTVFNADYAEIQPGVKGYRITSVMHIKVAGKTMKLGLLEDI